MGLQALADCDHLPLLQLLETTEEYTQIVVTGSAWLEYCFPDTPIIEWAPTLHDLNATSVCLLPQGAAFASHCFSLQSVGETV